MSLTAADVAAALAQPIEERDGQYLCQVCDRAFTSKQGMGPHQLTHRRQVGLAPPRTKNNIRIPTTVGGMVVCREPGCSSRLMRTNYRRHLRETHGLSPEEARDVMAEHTEAAVKAPVAVIEERPAEPEAEPLMTDLSAAEAAAGILSAARRDGLVPVAMLPALFAWIGHTERILDELERRTNA